MKQEMQAEYDPPSVVDLGSLVEITGSASTAGSKNDNGMNPTNKSA